MFNVGGSSPSLADIAAVTGNERNNDGWGNGMGGWWVLIILLALFGGFGGWGNNRNNGGGNACDTGTTIIMPAGGYGMGGYGTGFAEAAVQRGFDNQAVITKLDGINSGICGLGYDQLAQMNGINTNIMQASFGLQNQIQQNTVAGMQNTNALQAQLSDCCCENRAAIAQVRYDMATDTCALKNEVHQTGDAIIQNQTAGFQMLNNTIRDGFTELRMEQKDQYIAQLENQLNKCDLNSALQGTASYIINTVRPTAIPSYDVPNPYTGCCGNNYSGCGCGNNNGCCA